MDRTIPAHVHRFLLAEKVGMLQAIGCVRNGVRERHQLESGKEQHEGEHTTDQSNRIICLLQRLPCLEQSTQRALLRLPIMQDCVLEGDNLQVEESWCVSHRHVHAISCRPCHALHRLAVGEVQILEALLPASHFHETCAG